MNALYQISYISRSAIIGNHQTIENEIANILQVAQGNNRSQDITGALLYSGGYFCQVIEGIQENIETLFESIQMDARHRAVTVLHYEPITSRQFGDWQMALALAGIEEPLRFDVDGLVEDATQIKIKESAKDIVNTLYKLVMQKQHVLSQQTGQ